ncbi:MAG TPA: long-chain fatty acid--CoA ligase [Longimicrobiales bacterium]|nr:long-chain fatty acid--CoA ligase [Longimicrobiales bacterium]
MLRQTSTFVPDWLEKRTQLTPERTALTFAPTGETTTYAEWNERANRTANLLAGLGVGRGDLVSVYSSNRPEYLDLFFACNKTGAILHNLNWRLTVHELRAILAAAEPVVLVYSPEWREQVNALREPLRSVRHFVALGEPAAPGDLSFGERETQPATLQRRVPLEADDPWAIYYTGGTTGTPKGAVLTYGNMTWNSVNTIVSWGVEGDDVAPLQLPFFHIGGPNIFMLPLVHLGGRTILCTGFDPDETFDLVESGGITRLVGVPTMFVVLQQHPRWAATDFTRLRLVISGGAPCPLPVMQRFWERGVDFKMGYGLTEAAGNNFWLPQKDVRRKPGSVGFPIFHIGMEIVRPDGSACDAGEEGELLIRGPHVIPGYWKQPEATAQAIRDGWLYTGDIARRDEDGFFYVVGRSKEMFISGGENVYPAEIESVLYAHADVREAALVAVPHEKWGEVGRAYVVLEPGREPSAEAILAFLRERLARYKLPHSITFVDQLPKTAIGKIDKRQLVEATRR